jgi:hypothetical protein
MGQSTVTMATDTIGLALGAQDNYGRFLKNDSRTQTVLTGANFKTKQDKHAFRDDWQETHTGENRYKVAVLPIGMDIKSIGVSAKDAELLDARKFSRIEICSLFDVPPHLIGETEKTATYASVEQFNIMFVTFCILPRAILWEQKIKQQLMFRDSDYPKFSLSALLRGDTAARFGAYQIAVQNGWMSQNDVRIEEDLNPIPDGDNYWRPLAWARLGDVHVSVQKGGEGEQDQGTQSTTSGQGARVDERFLLLAAASAERCVRKEMAAVRRITERDRSREEIQDFYRDHAEFISKVLKISPEKAQAYCERRAAKASSLPDSDASIRELTALALGGVQ